jgi:hypothetical protein
MKHVNDFHLVAEGFGCFGTKTRFACRWRLSGSDVGTGSKVNSVKRVSLEDSNCTKADMLDTSSPSSE